VSPSSVQKTVRFSVFPCTAESTQHQSLLHHSHTTKTPNLTHSDLFWIELLWVTTITQGGKSVKWVDNRGLDSRQGLAYFLGHHICSNLGPPSLCYVYHGLFPQGERGRNVTLTTHLQPVRKLQIWGVTPPLPDTCSRQGASLSTATTLPSSKMRNCVWGTTSITTSVS
jgi:hypothetical protein